MKVKGGIQDENIMAQAGCALFCRQETSIFKRDIRDKNSMAGSGMCSLLQVGCDILRITA